MSYQYAEVVAPKGAPLLFLLHGTGGDEHDLLNLGGQVAPNAHLVSPRGDVSENGAPRFFRRLAMGVYDMADLKRATDKMAEFIAARIAATGAAEAWGLGYSNGANILASVLFAAPELLSKAVLMHPLVPFDPPPQPGLAGREVLITAGRRDSIVPVSATERLAAYLAAQGATVAVAWYDGGHELRASEVAAARAFLSDNS